MAQFSNTQTTLSPSDQGTKNFTKPFITITFLFFMWGFITVMNDVLIPHLKAVFELSYAQAVLVQFAFFVTFFVISAIYFLISTYSGDPISKIGYKNGIIIGLSLGGLGCYLFYPAAEYKVYAFFLGALFVLASGVTILQIAANPYAAILGKPQTASSRLNLAQGFNSLGTTIAPLVGALLIYKIFSNGEVTVDNVKLPYLIFGSIFFFLALVVRFSHLPSFVNEDKIEKGAGALKYRHLVLGMIAIFMYVGGEVAIGSFLVNFFALENIMGFEESIGATYLSFYWGGAMIGRFLGAISLGGMDNQVKKIGLMSLVSIGIFLFIYLITGIRSEGGTFYLDFMPFQKIGIFLVFLILNYLAFIIGKSQPGRTLGIFSLIIIVLLLITASFDGLIAFWAAIGTGLFNSIMWSNIFTLAIKDLGKYTSQGSSLLVMMIVGGAIIPALMGLIADVAWIGLQLSFLFPIICYIYLMYYGFEGYKVKEVDIDTEV